MPCCADAFNLAGRNIGSWDLHSWASTFCGTLAITPSTPLGIMRSRSRIPRRIQDQKLSNFRRIQPFEYFLWSDVRVPPSFESIKKCIAAAVDLIPADLRFETVGGERLAYTAAVLPEFNRLCDVESSRDLWGKPLLEVRVVFVGR
ncbi:unnamed protein product [Prorocentrum cordatum]|uniref:Uncharacterized protein n=1 Tax=Prorocentrum cordatum TaxID=2364126 RepID=A0ABN9SV73_9DINO|nr:unnamed protein product [Polarella glacialis]CAK0893074.1 unnamed protein product [Polarella glacialis]